MYSLLGVVHSNVFNQKQFRVLIDFISFHSLMFLPFLLTLFHETVIKNMRWTKLGDNFVMCGSD